MSYVIQNFNKISYKKKIHIKYVAFTFKRNYQILSILNYMRLLNFSSLYYINFFNRIMYKNPFLAITNYLIFFKKSKKKNNKLNNSLIFNFLNERENSWLKHTYNNKFLQIINRKMFFLFKKNFNFQLIMIFYMYLCTNRLPFGNYSLSKDLNFFTNCFINIKFYSTLFLKSNLF